MKTIHLERYVPTGTPVTNSIALQIALEKATSTLQKIPARDRPKKLGSLKRLLQKVCSSTALYIVSPVCLVEALSSDPKTGIDQELGIVLTMLEREIPENIRKKLIAVPDMVLERVRMSLAKRLATGTFFTLTKPKGLIELCVWITQVAYVKPCVSVDNIIRGLDDCDVLGVDDNGDVVYKMLDGVSHVGGDEYKAFLSPIVLPRFHRTLPIPLVEPIRAFRPSNTTALVIVPPLKLWAPYIEFVMDTHLGELMRRPPYPHITLMNAFVPKPSIKAVLAELCRTMAQISPFELTFPHLNVLAATGVVNMDPCPHPPGSLDELQRKIKALMPQSKYKFKKHIGMGHLCSPIHEEYFQQFSQRWQEMHAHVSFTVSHVLVMELPELLPCQENQWDLDWQLLVQGPNRPLGRQVQDARPWTVAAVVPLKGVADDELPVLRVGQSTLMSELCPEEWLKLQSRPMKSRLPSELDGPKRMPEAKESRERERASNLQKAQQRKEHLAAKEERKRQGRRGWKTERDKMPPQHGGRHKAGEGIVDKECLDVGL